MRLLLYCRGSRPPTVYKCETTFARLPLRGIPIYTLRIYVSRTHVCYNRYPPHVDSNILYSSQLLALLFGCVCLRHNTVFIKLIAESCTQCTVFITWIAESFQFYYCNEYTVKTQKNILLCNYLYNEGKGPL